jgi:hypothetical protein
MSDKINAYLANQLGFSETGKYVLEKLIKPELKRIGLNILDPFEECEKQLDRSILSKLEYHDDVMEFWKEFNRKVSIINNHLMEISDVMTAILDGSHAVDDGLSSEIGNYYQLRKGPIFALRSDFRICENIAAPINVQVAGYIENSMHEKHHYRGKLITGPDSISRWLIEIENWYKTVKIK